MSQSAYATAEETAAVITRKATPNETWLEAQLQRINPYLGDTGSGDGLRETELLAYQLRDRKLGNLQPQSDEIGRAHV